MPPSYYREGLWSGFSGSYDLFVKLVLLPWGGEIRFRKLLVDFSNPGSRKQILDVCCGTGSLTSLLSQRAGVSGCVLGVDLSASMLRRAREKAKDCGASFLKANAEHLPFPGGTFDQVFVSLGLHEMPCDARRNTLQEILRTLKPGGSLFVLDYNLPKRGWGCLAIKAFVKLFEDGHVYEMLLEGSLPAEIEEAGLILTRRVLLYRDTIQVMQADKLIKKAP